MRRQWRFCRGKGRGGQSALCPGLPSPALSVHWKRRRIHFRVPRRSWRGRARRAKASISFPAESCITDPPSPPDGMTHVIYHMGPARQRGGGGEPGACDAVPLPACGPAGSTLPIRREERARGRRARAWEGAAPPVTRGCWRAPDAPCPLPQ